MTTVLLDCPACEETITVPVRDITLTGDTVTVRHCDGWVTVEGLPPLTVRQLMMAIVLERRDDLADALDRLDRAVSPEDLWPSEEHDGWIPNGE